MTSKEVPAMVSFPSQHSRYASYIPVLRLVLKEIVPDALSMYFQSIGVLPVPGNIPDW